MNKFLHPLSELKTLVKVPKLYAFLLDSKEGNNSISVGGLYSHGQMPEWFLMLFNMTAWHCAI